MFLSRVSLEPGIFGIARPVLVWPEGISSRLDDAHVEAILAHEVGHVRRRDNLFAAIHMLVQAIFWFHPLVWFLGTRLVEEREVACDEAVLELGSKRQVYAESILKICEFCVGSPLACVSGATGADLKKRIVRIMTPAASRKLDSTKKLLLGVAAFLAIAVPIAFGVAYAAPRTRQSQGAAANVQEYKYEVASIRPTKSNPKSHHSDTTVDEFRATNVTLIRLIRQSYLLQFGPGVDDGRVVGGPNWVDSDGFDFDAKIDGSTVDALNKLGPVEREAARERMLQALLKERFSLVIHTETKEFPVYVLSLAKSGAKVSSDSEGKVTAQGVTIEDLAQWLSRRVGRSIVDKTGLKGVYDFSLSWTRDENENSADPTISPILAAVQQQLGLKLESGKGPVEIIVIDHAEKPSVN